MKRLTYDITHGQFKLVYEQRRDDQGRIIYTKDYLARPVIEVLSQFGDHGLIVSQTEYSDGIETSKMVCAYDPEGKPRSTEIHINGALWEEIRFDHGETGFTRTTFQEGQVVEKMIVIEERRKESTKFYQHGELTGFEIRTWSENQQEEKIAYHNELGACYATSSSRLDEKGRVVFREDRNEFDTVHYISISEYKDDFLVREEVTDYNHPVHEKLIHTWEYDRDGDLEKLEVHTPSGKMVEWLQNSYDEHKRLIEERGFCRFRHDSTYVNYFENDAFHFRHTYEPVTHQP